MSDALPPDLTAARYLDGYRLVLTFADGKRGILDMKDELHGRVFEPLKDVKLFKSFSFDRELATVVWPTGADLAPEFLYERATSSGNALQSLPRRAPAATKGTGPRPRTEVAGPEVSQFLGMVVEQVYDGLAPPQFLVRYGSSSAQFEIATGKVLSGSLSPTARRFVREWLALHRDELATNWTRLEKRLPLKRIAPLE